MSKVKFVFFDVDGTLTDGKIYIGNKGEIFKAFNVKDGAGIKDILIPNDIIPVIITARKSRSVLIRGRELGINYIFQFSKNKIATVIKFIEYYNKKYKSEYLLSNCFFIGDDMADLPIIKEIKANNGLSACPLDAINEIKQHVNYISRKKAGEGAVRDIIEWLLNKEMMK